MQRWDSSPQKDDEENRGQYELTGCDSWELGQLSSNERFWAPFCLLALCYCCAWQFGRHIVPPGHRFPTVLRWKAENPNLELQRPSRSTGNLTDLPLLRRHGGLGSLIAPPVACRCAHGLAVPGAGLDIVRLVAASWLFVRRYCARRLLLHGASPTKAATREPKHQRCLDKSDLYSVSCMIAPSVIMTCIV